MALAPPFVVSTALSSTGLFAAGTADGRLWIGCGGQKRPSSKASKKKKTKKWGGLNKEEEVVIKIAEGPLAAMYVRFFRDDRNDANVGTGLLMTPVY